MVPDATPTDDGATPSEIGTTQPSAEKTLVLLDRARQGDGQALEQLCTRYLPRLSIWASGRLPHYARGQGDTADLVQETFISTIRNIEQFEPRHEGAFQGYMRRALQNKIKDEIRKYRVRPTPTELDDRHVHPGPSPFEEAVGNELAERYEAAFQRLKEEDQDAVFLRIELDLGYQEIAEALNKPSANAARMAVSRALLRLAGEMRHDRPG